MTADEIRDGIDGVTWYHQIDLGEGVITPGSDATIERMKFLGMPEDLPRVEIGVQPRTTPSA